MKADHERAIGLLQPLKASYRKWNHITVDFVCGLLRTLNGHDTIWVIIDQLTNATHFILMRLNYSIDKLSELYIQKVAYLHAVPYPSYPTRTPYLLQIIGRAYRNIGH